MAHSMRSGKGTNNLHENRMMTVHHFLKGAQVRTGVDKDLSENSSLTSMHIDFILARSDRQVFPTDAAHAFLVELRL